MSKIALFCIFLMWINPAVNVQKDTSEIISKKMANTKESRVYIDGIPQGTFEYELYYSEFGGRLSNGICNVKISGNKITVLQKKGVTRLTGGSVIAKGILIKHKSGKWIIADTKADAKVEEFGGCTGGPIPIDFEKKLIEWC